MANLLMLFLLLQTNPDVSDISAISLAVLTVLTHLDLGPTSYTSILPKDEAAPVLRDREGSVAFEGSDHELDHQYPLTKNMRIQMATEILTTLRHYPIFQEVVTLLAKHGTSSIVPLPLEVNLLNAMGTIVDRFNLMHSVPDPRLVLRVLDNSSQSFVIPDAVKACDFHHLCSGDNLRLETLGFVLSTAGRAISFGLCSYLFSDPANPNARPRLLDELLRASTMCIMLCAMVSPVNHLTIWMLYENYAFTVMTSGFSGTVPR